MPEDAARPRGSCRSPASLGGDKSDSTPDSCQPLAQIRKHSKACGRPPPRPRGEGMGLAAQIHCQRPGLQEAGPRRRRVRPAGSFRQRPSRVEPVPRGTWGGAGSRWRPPRCCGHPGASCAALAQLWALRMACQAAGTDGPPCPRHSRPWEPAQATVLQTHTARRPRSRPRVHGNLPHGPLVSRSPPRHWAGAQGSG